MAALHRRARMDAMGDARDRTGLDEWGKVGLDRGADWSDANALRLTRVDPSHLVVRGPVLVGSITRLFPRRGAHVRPPHCRYHHDHLRIGRSAVAAVSAIAPDIRSFQ